MSNLPILIPIVFVGLVFLSKWINVLNEYERAVTFWLGRLSPAPKGPGLTLIFWPFETMVRISLRTVVLEVPPQDVITRDNVSVKVNAVVYFHVMDPARARNESAARIAAVVTAPAFSWARSSQRERRSLPRARSSRTAPSGKRVRPSPSPQAKTSRSPVSTAFSSSSVPPRKGLKETHVESDPSRPGSLRRADLSLEVD